MTSINLFKYYTVLTMSLLRRTNRQFILQIIIKIWTLTWSEFFVTCFSLFLSLSLSLLFHRTFTLSSLITDDNEPDVSVISLKVFISAISVFQRTGFFLFPSMLLHYIRNKHILCFSFKYYRSGTNWRQWMIFNTALFSYLQHLHYEAHFTKRFIHSADPWSKLYYYGFGRKESN